MKNLGDMMKQVQAMQSRMADMQAKLEQATVIGQSGGGLVQVTLSGKGAMTALNVDASLLNQDEKEILEDLIIAAHADAKGKSEAMMAEEMKSVTGGMALPPGMKLPF
jgi:nucleoid-associated protein EbfC